MLVMIAFVMMGETPKCGNIRGPCIPGDIVEHVKGLEVRFDTVNGVIPDLWVERELLVTALGYCVRDDAISVLRNLCRLSAVVDIDGIGLGRSFLQPGIPQPV